MHLNFWPKVELSDCCDSVYYHDSKQFYEKDETFISFPLWKQNNNCDDEHLYKLLTETIDQPNRWQIARKPNLITLQ